MTSYIGEIGLDRRPEHRASWPQQVEVFERVLLLVRSSGQHKVLSLHSTKAVADVVSRLAPCGNCSSVLHWFTGTKQELQLSVDAGCWFRSTLRCFAPRLERSASLRCPAIVSCPRATDPSLRLVVDARAPTDVDQVIHGLAHLWQESPADVERCLEQNLMQLVSQLSR